MIVFYGFCVSLCPNLCCRSPPAMSCWFYLPVVPIALPVEKKKNGACLQQRVHSWLEDKTLPDCKYKHGAGGFLLFFFSGLRTLTVITDEQSKS